MNNLTDTVKEDVINEMRVNLYENIQIDLQKSILSILKSYADRANEVNISINDFSYYLGSSVFMTLSKIITREEFKSNMTEEEIYKMNKLLVSITNGFNGALNSIKEKTVTTLYIK